MALICATSTKQSACFNNGSFWFVISSFFAARPKGRHLSGWSEYHMTEFSHKFAQALCPAFDHQILAPAPSSFDAKDNFMRKDDSNISATTQLRCLNNY